MLTGKNAYATHCGRYIFRQNIKAASCFGMNFGCFSLSRFSQLHCNTMRKVIKVQKNLHTNQQNEHTP